MLKRLRVSPVEHPDSAGCSMVQEFSIPRLLVVARHGTDKAEGAPSQVSDVLLRF